MNIAQSCSRTLRLTGLCLIGLALQYSHNVLAASAVLIKDINPSGIGVFQNHRMAALNDSLIFIADDSVHGFEIWKSDGTATGTALVKDTVLGLDSHISGFLVGMRFAQLGNSLLYSGNISASSSRELWMTDGSDIGTVLVKDVNPGDDGSSPVFQTAIGSTVYFRAFHPSYGSELWKSDGTTAGTVLVKDINAGPTGSELHDLTEFNGMLFFRADDGVNGEELWRSDGTLAGTVMVKDINPSGDGFFFSNEVLTVVDGTLYFAADDGAHGTELWKSDGTTGGTVLVKDIYTGLTGSDPVFSGHLNGTLVFIASNGSNGRELWKSDGTAAGTVLVKDINPYGDSVPSLFLGFGGRAIFIADNGVKGRELWITDGTTAGTSLIKDIRSGADSSNATPMTVIDGVVFLEADDGIHGDELWMSDGTEFGTVLVEDINPGAADGLAPLFQSFAVVNGALVFSAEGPNGWELYGLDSDEDGLSDLGEATLGTDPASSDTDGDTIPDDSDPDTIATAVRELDPITFDNHGDPQGQRNAMLKRLDEIEQLILDGDIEGALRELRGLRRHVDGCGVAPDPNDWIIDCAAQITIRNRIDLLIMNLSP